MNRTVLLLIVFILYSGLSFSEEKIIGRGIGLVTELDGKGDKENLMYKSMLGFLKDDYEKMKYGGGNCAVVSVMMSFDIDSKFVDCSVQSLGDAVSLEGGLLLPTQLKVNFGLPKNKPKVLAIISGNVIVSPIAVSGNVYLSDESKVFNLSSEWSPIVNGREEIEYKSRLDPVSLKVQSSVP